MNRALEALAARVSHGYAQRETTLGFAESLTGGLAAATLCSVPGTSRMFAGSIVSYASSVKRDVLGVEANVIETYGAPSAEVAAQMARGARRVLDCDVAVAMTGVAGPLPQDGWDVGHVHVALFDGESLVIQHGHVRYSRRRLIRLRTVQQAFTMALEALD